MKTETLIIYPLLVLLAIGVIILISTLFEEQPAQPQSNFTWDDAPLEIAPTPTIEWDEWVKPGIVMGKDVDIAFMCNSQEYLMFYPDGRMLVAGKEEPETYLLMEQWFAKHSEAPWPLELDVKTEGDTSFEIDDDGMILEDWQQGGISKGGFYANGKGFGVFEGFTLGQDDE